MFPSFQCLSYFLSLHYYFRPSQQKELEAEDDDLVFEDFARMRLKGYDPDDTQAWTEQKKWEEILQLADLLSCCHGNYVMLRQWCLLLLLCKMLFQPFMKL